MALTDFSPTGPVSDPARVARNFRDKETGIPREALACLSTLHGEAGRDLYLLQFLARSPQFCVALMLAGAVTLIWTSEEASGDTLSANFAWVTSLVIGITAITHNYIQGFARSPTWIPPQDATAELRTLLVYLGLAWGLGSFLVVPALPSSVLAFAFAAGPGLTCALTLRDDKGVIAFSTPVCLLTTSAALLEAWPYGTWIAGLTLVVGVAIVGYSMLQCAIQRRRILLPILALR
jgi:hypothetical protein